MGAWRQARHDPRPCASPSDAPSRGPSNRSVTVRAGEFGRDHIADEKSPSMPTWRYHLRRAYLEAAGRMAGLDRSWVPSSMLQTDVFDREIAEYAFGADGWPKALCIAIFIGATGQLIYQVLAAVTGRARRTTGAGDGRARDVRASRSPCGGCCSALGSSASRWSISTSSPPWAFTSSRLSSSWACSLILEVKITPGADHGDLPWSTASFS